MTFFVSPSPLAEYEHIGINITVPSGCEKDPDYQPALIFWDKGNLCPLFVWVWASLSLPIPSSVSGC